MTGPCTWATVPLHSFDTITTPFQRLFKKPSCKEFRRHLRAKSRRFATVALLNAPAGAGRRRNKIKSRLSFSKKPSCKEFRRPQTAE